MKLLCSAPSPFVRKVMITLHETGQLDEIERQWITTTPVASHADLIAANPVGKIPALIRSNAPTIYDSRVICRFLDDRAGAGLYPENRLWDVLTLEATADGILDAAVLMVYEMRLRPQEQQSPEWIAAQWAKVSRALDALETRWMSHLQGPFDMSHIAIGSALGYLDFRHGPRDWRTGRDSLAAWYDALSTRPSMQETAPND